MKYTITERNGVAEVHLEGQLNFSANEEFHVLLDKLLAMKPNAVTFHMGKLSMVDSVGLGLLYIANEDLGNIRAPITLAGATDGVARLLDLTEANKLFTLAP